MIKLSTFFNPLKHSRTITAEVDNTAIYKYLISDFMVTFERKVASYCARIYIKHRRAEIERFISHPATQRRIAREVKKILERELGE